MGGTTTISTSATRIEALNIQSSAYGVTIPLVYGSNRLSGNMVWYGDFKATAHTSTQSSGGKGGGGVTQQNTTYTYSASTIMGLCEGPITGVSQIWKDKQLIADIAGGATALSQLGMSLAAGAEAQSTWAYLTTFTPTGGVAGSQALGYSGLAYVYAQDYQLGSSASVVNHSFEIKGKLYGVIAGSFDSNTALAAADVLTNARYGAAFPSGNLLATDWSNYVLAAGLLTSPALTEQMQAGEFVAKVCALTNTGAVWSGGQLKMVPYGDTAMTGNGATYTPNVTPLFDLTDDDFTPSVGDDPIKVTRKPQADAYNHIRIEFVNRANAYNVEISEAKDSANIDIYGLRSADVLSAHWICDAAVARTMAQLLLQRAMYIRNTYEFSLPWTKALLEPMDLVTLTDSGLGLNKLAVRVTEVGESDSGELSIVAEDYPVGVAHAALYTTQAGAGFQSNYNATPGNVSPAAFVEHRVGKQIVVSIAVTGQAASWGGCYVWVSLDGISYKYMTVVHGGARYGTLKAASGSATTDTFDVQLAGNGGQLLSGTPQDADLYLTDCFVDGEFVAYEAATLTAANRYTLSNLRRGGYGSPATAHAIGSPFIRLDDAVVDSDLLELSMIGKPIYFKFLSFNIYGGAAQGLADVSPAQYNITGAALLWTLANVANLVDSYRDGRTLLVWDAIVDDRTVDYEVRKGATWATAQILGRVGITEFVADGDGTYWVSAHAAGPAYSAAPTSLLIAGSVLTANVVATVDEEATLWAGTCTGGAAVSGTDIVLSGAGLFSAIPVLSAVGTVVYFGGVASAGVYTIPASHEVDVGTSQPCNCSVSYRLKADSPFALFSSVTSVALLASLSGNYAGFADAKVQIATAPDSGVYGAWRDFVPGKYVGRKFKFQVLLTSSSTTVTAILDTLTFTVDMPDRVERGTAVACPAGGLSVIYAKPFQIAPNVQVTIQGATQNDDVVLTAQTSAGFIVQVVQGGTGVARTINWLAQGY